MQIFKNKMYKVAPAIIVFGVLMFAVPNYAYADVCDRISDQTTLKNCLKHNGITQDINSIINFLSAGAGVIIVASIIVGGIQYIMAGNNPNAVSAAKQRIINALIALVAFFFIFIFLEWLVPGGLLFS